MTLRQQIKEIADRRINPDFAKHVHFPATVNVLAVFAFEEWWSEGPETRAIRLALRLLNENGVSEDEPAVE